MHIPHPASSLAFGGPPGGGGASSRVLTTRPASTRTNQHVGCRCSSNAPVMHAMQHSECLLIKSHPCGMHRDMAGYQDPPNAHCHCVSMSTNRGEDEAAVSRHMRKAWTASCWPLDPLEESSASLASLPPPPQHPATSEYYSPISKTGCGCSSNPNRASIQISMVPWLHIVAGSPCALPLRQHVHCKWTC